MATLIKKLNKSVQKQAIEMEDYDNYISSFDKPAAFIDITVYDGDDFLGVLAIKIASSKINEILTSNYKWESIGLGKTGEI